MKRLLPALLGILIAAPAVAGDLALKVEHDITTLGADGVTRIVRFGERLVRRDKQSWVERILPPHAHEAEDHKAGDKGHKHMDTSAAARWVQLGEDGKLRVRIVNGYEKMIVDIAPVDYANIGFDGKWTTANQLLDPEQLKRMKASNRSAPAGTRWYEGGTAQTRVQVLWDEKEQYPRRIESANPAGTSRSTLIATREAMPARLPWTRLDGYVQKEYSDLLD
ncbi:hypothetical protein [Zoogloea sp.]|uniref:hypothetical protein n=1 Tax=Zoogloea sp. TaxID=49181 RepID=UPI0035AEAB48